MQALPNPEPVSEIDFNALRIESVTEDRKLAFYGLIQEQAKHHGVAPLPGAAAFNAARLYNTAIERKGINAFLVAYGETPLATVTYYNEVTPRGTAIHLEDIVVKKGQRHHHVGTRALRELARIAFAQGVDEIVWECAWSNREGQAFYDKFGAHTHFDFHTLRSMGGVPAEAVAGYVCRPMESRDVEQVAVQMAWCGQGRADRIVSWLGEAVATPPQDHIYLVAENERSPGIAGALLMNRSFSTFRMVNGANIGALAAIGDRQAAVRTLLAACAREQTARGWEGHCDWVLPVAQGALNEAAEAAGFAQLNCGPNSMALRSLDRAQIAQVAFPMQEPRLPGARPTSASPYRILHLNAA